MRSKGRRVNSNARRFPVLQQEVPVGTRCAGSAAQLSPTGADLASSASPKLVTDVQVRKIGGRRSGHPPGPSVHPHRRLLKGAKCTLDCFIDGSLPAGEDGEEPVPELGLCICSHPPIGLGEATLDPGRISHKKRPLEGSVPSRPRRQGPEPSREQLPSLGRIG